MELEEYQYGDNQQTPDEVYFWSAEFSLLCKNDFQTITVTTLPAD